MTLLIAILNSNFFVGILTILAGFIAYLIYKSQKKDYKKDAANIILLEIQNAERVLLQVGENIEAGVLPNKFLLPTDSWSDYKYLFVRDFDRDEWDNITTFYNNCKLYDESVSYNNSLFQKNEEEIRRHMIRIPAEYLHEYLNKNTLGNTQPIVDPQELARVFERATEFQKHFLSRADLLLYSPQKPIGDAKIYFSNLNPHVSQTSIGLKLKKLAKIKV